MPTDYDGACIKGLYDQKLPQEDVARLFRFIDWIMELPRNLGITFYEEFQEFQKENKVPYITQTEQLWIDKGHLKALRQALKARFGAEGEQLALAQNILRRTPGQVASSLIFGVLSRRGEGTLGARKHLAAGVRS